MQHLEGGKGYFRDSWSALFFLIKCEMANFFLMNRDFHGSHKVWFCKIIFRETRNKWLIHCDPWFSLCLCYFRQPLLCNKLYCVAVTERLIPVVTTWPQLVGLVFSDLWSGIIFIFSKKNDAVVRFLLHTLNIVLSCTLDTNLLSRFSKDDAAKPASHEFSWPRSDE